MQSTVSDEWWSVCWIRETIGHLYVLRHLRIHLFIIWSITVRNNCVHLKNGAGALLCVFCIPIRVFGREAVCLRPCRMELWPPVRIWFVVAGLCSKENEGPRCTVTAHDGPSILEKDDMCHVFNSVTVIFENLWVRSSKGNIALWDRLRAKQVTATSTTLITTLAK